MPVFNMAKGKPTQPPKNTFVEFSLATGETVKLTLAYYLLLGLKKHCREAYDRYNQVSMKGAKEELDMLAILHAAYLCAYIQENGAASGSMDFDEFAMACGSDHASVNEAVRALLDPKGKAGSATHS